MLCRYLSTRRDGAQQWRAPRHLLTGLVRLSHIHNNGVWGITHRPLLAMATEKVNPDIICFLDLGGKRMKRGLIIILIVALLLVTANFQVALAGSHDIGDGDTLDLSTGLLTHSDGSTQTYTIADTPGRSRGGRNSDDYRFKECGDFKRFRSYAHVEQRHDYQYIAQGSIEQSLLGSLSECRI